MVFSNQATLTYAGVTIPSNVTTGTLVPTLTFAKSAMLTAYQPKEVITYQCMVTNTGSTSLHAVRLLDNLGRYDWTAQFWRFPLEYLLGSEQLRIVSATGVQAGSVTVVPSFDGVTFTFDVPAAATALLTYNTRPTAYAPLAAGAAITNTATLTPPAPFQAIVDSVTLPVAEAIDLHISKQACPASGGEVRYGLTVSNHGNAAVTAQSNVVATDRLTPMLTGLRVYGGQTPWTKGTQYTYDEQTGLFSTIAGALTLPPADFTQSTAGVWTVQPSSLRITLTGTPSAAPAPQAVVTVTPGYADGRARFLTVTRLRNDEVRLTSTDAVPPIFHIGVEPDASLTLLPSSDSHFSLDGAMLIVSYPVPMDAITAFVQVNRAEGAFVVRLTHTLT